MMYFKYDEKALMHLQKVDARMGKIIEKLGFIKRKLNPSIIDAVLHHIIGQQISSKAQETVWTRLTLKMQDLKLDYVDLDEENLLACGIPLRKVHWILSFLTKIRNGSFDVEKLKHMDDDEAISYLSSLDGIGKWTAQMILLFCLNRMNVFSQDDLGIRRGIRMLYQREMLNSDFLHKLEKRYAPYGSVACIYLWAIAGGAIEEFKDPGAQLDKKSKIPLKKQKQSTHNIPQKSTNIYAEKQESFLYNKDISLATYASPQGLIIIAVKKAVLIALRFIDRINAEKIIAHRTKLVVDACDVQVLSKTCVWLQQYFDGKIEPITVSFQAEGTTFQKAIWELLLKIPYGGVISYKDLAKSYCEKYHVARMSAQAIGKAVGSNPIAIIIPCHRVIGADGSLTGYAYGLERKKFLLELEKERSV